MAPADPGEAADLELAGELARGADGRPRFAATVVRTLDGAVVARAADSVVDRLAAALLARLTGEPEERVAILAARPLDAVRAYLAARAAYRAGRYVVAESLYGRAADLDTTFALAGLGLAMANSWTGINEHYGRGRDLAWSRQERLSPRDREFLRAWFGPDPELGRPQPAPVYLKRWEDVVEKWPDWTEAWYEVGDRYYHFGGLSGWADPAGRALAAFRRAVELDSAFVAPLHHLTEILAARGDTAELRRIAARYFSANPHVSRDGSAIGWQVAIALGDSAWASRVRRNLPAMAASELDRVVWVTLANGWPAGDADAALDAADRKTGATNTWRENALALRWAAALNRGDGSRAHEAAVALEALTPDQPVAALWDMLAVLFGGADTAYALEAAPRLAALARAPAPPDEFDGARRHMALCLLALWQAANGEAGEARRNLFRLENALAAEPTRLLGQLGHPRECALTLHAVLAAARRERQAPVLLAQLDAMLLRDRVPPRVTLAAGAVVSQRLHERAGDVERALAAARRREHLTGHPFFLATQLQAEARLARD